VQVAVKAKAQASFDEEVLEDADLEARLERRERAKAEAGTLGKSYRDLDTEVKGEILKMGHEGPVNLRCGRFIIEVKPRPSRSVSFETKPGTKINIKAPEGD
jgi:hypothetical protein